MSKGNLIKHIKVVEDTGNIIEVKLWQVESASDKRQGYKYSLVYVVQGKRVIGYDNAEGKGTTDIMETKRMCTRLKA